MKRLGIIGGLGPLASSLFYEKLVLMCYQYREDIPDLLLVNHPFTRDFCPKGLEEGNSNEELIKKGFHRSLKILIKNEIKYAVMVCNSMHLYLEDLPQNAPYFFRIPELVMEKALEMHCKSILVLGSRITRDSQFYYHPQISACYPSEKDQHIIDNAIANVLRGRILQRDSDNLTEVINNCESFANFDAVALACTDLPIIHTKFPLKTSKLILDSIDIPAKKVSLLL